MPEYQMLENGGVRRFSDDACIMPDERNRDWLGYLAWKAAGNAAAPYVPPPAPVPQSISDRQFFQQLAIQGVITETEALAAVKTGAVPTALQALIDAMPTDQQFGATMIVSGATTFERCHELTLAIGRAYGWTSDQMDALWRAAAEL
jgi:hypothetical protein